MVQVMTGKSSKPRVPGSSERRALPPLPPQQQRRALSPPREHGARSLSTEIFARRGDGAEEEEAEEEDGGRLLVDDMFLSLLTKGDGGAVDENFLSLLSENNSGPRVGSPLIADCTSGPRPLRSLGLADGVTTVLSLEKVDGAPVSLVTHDGVHSFPASEGQHGSWVWSEGGGQHASMVTFDSAKHASMVTSDGMGSGRRSERRGSSQEARSPHGQQLARSSRMRRRSSKEEEEEERGGLGKKAGSIRMWLEDAAAGLDFGKPEDEVTKRVGCSLRL